jgi:hypothetical protein
VWAVNGLATAKPKRSLKTHRQDTSARHIGKTHRGESDGARGQILHLGWGEISGLKVVTLRLYGFLMPSDLAALSGC